MWIQGNNPALDATKVPSTLDVAWAAGFWEGEGSVRVTQRRSFSIQAVQKDPEMLYRLRDWFGGSVRFARCKTTPVEHQVHVWECCGDRGRMFIAMIYQFLSTRRRSKVDSINALQFLRGATPLGLSMCQLKNALADFNKTERDRVKRSPARTFTEEFRTRKNERQRAYRAVIKAVRTKVVSIA